MVSVLSLSVNYSSMDALVRPERKRHVRDLAVDFRSGKSVDVVSSNPLRQEITTPGSTRPKVL